MMDHVSGQKLSSVGLVSAWMGNCLLPVSPVPSGSSQSWTSVLVAEGDLSLSQRAEGPLGLFQCPDVRWLCDHSDLLKPSSLPCSRSSHGAHGSLSPDPVGYRAVLAFPPQQESMGCVPHIQTRVSRATKPRRPSASLCSPAASHPPLPRVLRDDGSDTNTETLRQMSQATLLADAEAGG